MNRDCYLQHELLALLQPESEPGIPSGWVKSVDLACTQWLHDRGLPATPAPLRPGADTARELNTPLTPALSHDV